MVCVYALAVRTRLQQDHEGHILVLRMRAMIGISLLYISLAEHEHEDGLLPLFDVFIHAGHDRCTQLGRSVCRLCRAYARFHNPVIVPLFTGEVVNNCFVLIFFSSFRAFGS